MYSGKNPPLRKSNKEVTTCFLGDIIHIPQLRRDTENEQQSPNKLLTGGNNLRLNQFGEVKLIKLERSTELSDEYKKGNYYIPCAGREDYGTVKVGNILINFQTKGKGGFEYKIYNIDDNGKLSSVSTREVNSHQSVGFCDFFDSGHAAVTIVRKKNPQGEEKRQEDLQNVQEDLFNGLYGNRIFYDITQGVNKARDAYHESNQEISEYYRAIEKIITKYDPNTLVSIFNKSLGFDDKGKKTIIRSLSYVLIKRVASSGNAFAFNDIMNKCDLSMLYQVLKEAKKEGNNKALIDKVEAAFDKTMNKCERTLDLSMLYQVLKEAKKEGNDEVLIDKVEAAFDKTMNKCDLSMLYQVLKEAKKEGNNKALIDKVEAGFDKTMNKCERTLDLSMLYQVLKEAKKEGNGELTKKIEAAFDRTMSECDLSTLSGILNKAKAEKNKTLIDKTLIDKVQAGFDKTMNKCERTLDLSMLYQVLKEAKKEGNGELTKKIEAAFDRTMSECDLSTLSGILNKAKAEKNKTLIDKTLIDKVQAGFHEIINGCNLSTLSAIIDQAQELGDQLLIDDINEDITNKNNTNNIKVYNTAQERIKNASFEYNNCKDLGNLEEKHNLDRCQRKIAAIIKGLPNWQKRELLDKELEKQLKEHTLQPLTEEEQKLPLKDIRKKLLLDKGLEKPLEYIQQLLKGEQKKKQLENKSPIEITPSSILIFALKQALPKLTVVEEKKKQNINNKEEEQDNYTIKDKKIKRQPVNNRLPEDPNNKGGRE